MRKIQESGVRSQELIVRVQDPDVIPAPGYCIRRQAPAGIQKQNKCRSFLKSKYRNCSGKNPINFLSFSGLTGESIFPGFRIKCGMTVLALLLSLFITPNPSYIGSAFASDPDQAVARIQKHFESIKDIKGTFSQTSYIKDIEETQKYSGQFFIKKPSLMMWEYDKPRDEKVVIRDSDTWIYKKSENQVIKTKFNKESYSQVPIAMLGSMENIRKDFDISMPEENALQLIPKHRIGFLKVLVLEINSGDFPVKMFTIIDTYGNIIMIELYSMEVNPGLDDSLFQFEPPPDAEVYDLSH